MNVSSLLKSPSAMGGAGMLGSGGVGVGGWQLYEGVINPTTHRQLTSKGYTWSPAEVPAQDTLSRTLNSQYTWSSWGCVEKLFPGVEIKHNSEIASSVQIVIPTRFEPESMEEQDGPPQKKIYFEKPDSVSNKSIACALLDKREGPNRIYFKSEVAFRDESHGWIVWSGLSNPNNSNKVSFEYRLLLLEKENNQTWKIKTGFGWDSPESSTSPKSPDHLTINLPAGYWKSASNPETGYTSRKTWSGVAIVDESLKGKPHILESLDIYMKQNGSTPNQYAEFFGKSGNWTEGNFGYKKTNKIYSDGWKTIGTVVDLGETLKQWYEPFKDKYVRWTTCDEWSGNRRAPVQDDALDKTMTEMCYSQTQK